MQTICLLPNTFVFLYSVKQDRVLPGVRGYLFGYIFQNQHVSIVDVADDQ